MSGHSGRGPNAFRHYRVEKLVRADMPIRDFQHARTPKVAIRHAEAMLAAVTAEERNAGVIVRIEASDFGRIEIFAARWRDGGWRFTGEWAARVRAPTRILTDATDAEKAGQ